MAITATQTTAFFENPDQMGIPHATVIQLQVEGITVIQDLADFDKDTLQQLADNLRKPAGCIPDPNPAAAAGVTIPTPSFVFGVKSQHCISVACEIVCYYNAVGHDITAANMQWTQVIKNFEDQWKALKGCKEDDEPDVPKISKSLPIIKWTEAFQDFLHRVIGVRMIPLAYVTRAVVEVPAVVPALENNWPHSEEHGSVENELIAQALHKHKLFHEDNTKVYYHLEEATRGTSYVASIKPFQVSYLLDGIQWSDAGLQAAMASVRTDDGPQGMRNDFESAAVHLLPYDPVVKKRAASGNK